MQVRGIYVEEKLAEIIYHKKYRLRNNECICMRTKRDLEANYIFSGFRAINAIG